MILPDKVYSTLKWFLITFIPALVILINTLGGIYGFDPTVIVSTIGAFALFGAALLGLSNYNYKKGNSADAQ